ncbi:tRNA uridine 5-oxyacetic acid(34) methyltransferase CmoM [Martelella alba]|uniref:tRNA uridine 5-oxyacetic acid(34) methyltransferase CmoM n=1 Tax=Martelella alba TaxID=2590451 RepID=A0ABY2SPG1_9HYPH|nr:tRNA uridine 5-oxyacetic acid(34) methyltransferase CmoM [Martelella alba]TKI07499.1 tRNA uridine 5-oxyacetic acid(34) methyltransferase CmoM [Martelella alba]
MQDRNFDDIAEKFTRNIYGTTKGLIRQAVIWQDLQDLLTRLPGRPLYILDAGGGEGRMSRRLASLGHRVLLCDLSADMLARAQDAARQDGVMDNMQFVQGAIQEIAPHLERSVDLILLHAVLEWVAEPRKLLRQIHDYLAPGGALSLMFYNKHGLVMRNMVLGNIGFVKQGMPKRKKRSLIPDHPCDPEQVYRWLAELGMRCSGKSGVRVFHDYLQNKQQQKDAFPALLEMEQRYCRQEPFIGMGRYIHVMAHKLPLKDDI